MTIANVEKILSDAAARARANSLPYAGAVLPAEAYLLANEAGARIIDVRTRAEYEYVGRVPNTPLIEWKHWPNGELNGSFIEELQEQAGKNDIVLFLCRSGVRSHSAAALAAQAGFHRAYNVLEGFEGNLDSSGQRRTLGGWCKAGLPWVQS